MNSVIPSVDTIKAAASEAAFGKALVTNVLRSQIVEAIIRAALPDTWEWCSSDYYPYDFVHRSSGVRLEVKQSAARQSWAAEGAKASPCSWDIAEKKGFWEGSKWFPKPGRNAHIFIFAQHRDESEIADHRDARQWLFFVIAETRLPPIKRLSLSRAENLAKPVGYSELAETVELARSACAEMTV